MFENVWTNQVFLFQDCLDMFDIQGATPSCRRPPPRGYEAQSLRGIECRVSSIEYSVSSIEYSVFSIEYSEFSSEYSVFSIQYSVLSIQYSAFSIEY